MINKTIIFIEKYGFLFIFLFCFGFFSPDLTPKLGLMLDDSVSVEDGSKSSVLKQVFWLFLFGFFVLRTYSCKDVILTVSKSKLLLIFLALCSYCLITSFWSDFPSLTIKRSIFQLIFSFTVVLSIYFVCYHNNLTNSILLLSCFILALICYSVLNGTGFDRVGALTGFARGKNVLGQNLLVLLGVLLICLKSSSSSKKYLTILCGVFFILLVLTQSKTSILTFLVFLFFINTSKVFSRLLIPITFFVLASVFIFIPGLSAFFSDYIHVGLYLSPEAITGRGMIWETLYYDLNYFNKIPAGYGYSSYFNTGVVPYLFDDGWSYLSRINSSHNGFIDIFVQFGFYGSIIIAMCLFYIYLGIKDKILIACCIIPLINNITEATFLRDQNMVWLFVITIFTLSRVTNSAYKYSSEVKKGFKL